MSELETRARPHLTSLITGATPVILPGVALTLATWAVKTALVYGSKGDLVVPAAFPAEFGIERVPSSKTRVWLGRGDRQDFTYIDIRPSRVRASEDDPPPAEENGYVALVAMGQVWFYIVSWLGPKFRMDRFYTREIARRMTPLWPARDGINPSPDASVRSANLEALADQLGPVAAPPEL